MSKEDDRDRMIVNGEVIESCKGHFKIQTETGIILASISGKIRTNRIRILIGDVVDVEVTPYEPTKGRIIKRYQK